MSTPEWQVEEMREFCRKLDGELIKSAIVDDWGRYGNFQILVTPNTPNRHFTTRLKALIRKSLPPKAHLREVFPPDPIRERRMWGAPKKVVGYSRDYWVVDVDYQHYDLESNSFS